MVRLFGHAVQACGKANVVPLLACLLGTFLCSVDLSKARRHVKVEAGWQH